MPTEFELLLWIVLSFAGGAGLGFAIGYLRGAGAVLNHQGLRGAGLILEKQQAMSNPENDAQYGR